MSAHYQGQANEYNEQNFGKCRGEEGDDNISGITGGGTACVKRAPLRNLRKYSGGCRTGVSGCPVQFLEGGVVSELLQQSGGETSTIISPLVFQTQRARRQLGRGQVVTAVAFGTY